MAVAEAGVGQGDRMMDARADGARKKTCGKLVDWSFDFDIVAGVSAVDGV